MGLIYIDERSIFLALKNISYQTKQTLLSNMKFLLHYFFIWGNVFGSGTETFSTKAGEDINLGV